MTDSTANSPTSTPPPATTDVQALLQDLTQRGAAYAARGFAGMVGQPLTVSPPAMRLVPLARIPEFLGDPESEAVGIYLRVQGEPTWQILLILAYDKALELAGLILGNPAGETTQLGSLELSALGELGNLTGSFFINTIVSHTGLNMRPSPPAVMVDMLGAVLDVLIATYHSEDDVQEVLMLQVAFLTEDRRVQANFWVIPDPRALALLAPKGGDPHANQ